MASTYKRYYYKVYDTSTPPILKATWSADVISDPHFRSVINGGAGELVVRLSRKYDSYGEGSDVALNNKVELWVSDYEAPSGMKIYTGYISAYYPFLDGDDEYIEVTLLGYVTETSFKILKDGSGNTTVTYSGVDPSNILMDAISKYQADGNSNLHFNASTIDLTGTSVIYTFTYNTLQEVINKLTEFTPSNWYWRVDPATNDVYLKLADLNAAATHRLTIGKEITYLQTSKRVEGVVNQVFVVGGGNPKLFNMYTRNGSVSSYGKHESKIQDGNVTDNATSDAMAKRVLDTKQNPETRSIIRIADSNGENQNRGYDIEKIKPGDTVQIRNLSFGAKGISLWDQMQWDIDVWDQTFQYSAAAVMLVVSVDYYPEYVEIEASSRFPEVSKALDTQSKRIDQQLQSNLPSAPSVRAV